MKEISKNFLYDYINKHVYYDVLDYDMFKIFKLYSAFEIQSDKEVLSAIEDFVDFWKENVNLIKCNTLEDKESLIASVKHEVSMLRQFIKNSRTIEQVQFADIVDIISPSKERTSILDVGAGKYPYSSILLSEQNNNVTAMDNGFYLSDKSFASMKVNTLVGYFNENSNIDGFDFVVGRFPCSAIEHIVRKCKQHNKPYFIQLCECYAPDNDPTKPFTWKSWRSFLSEIDPSIQFYHTYAYNIDAEPSQIEAIIRRLRIRKYFQDAPPSKLAFLNKGFINDISINPSTKPQNDELEK